MSWFWNKKDYLKGASEAASEFFYSILANEFGGANIKSVDKEYTILQESQMRDFLFDNITVCDSMEYGSNRRDSCDSFPDCDDFAYVAIGQAINGAVKAGFRSMPAIGYLEYDSVSNGGRHAANFVVVAPFKPLVYEPQTGKIKDFNSEVKTVYRAEFV